MGSSFIVNHVAFLFFSPLSFNVGSQLESVRHQEYWTKPIEKEVTSGVGKSALSAPPPFFC